MAAANAVPGLKRLPKPDGCTTWYWSARQISREVGDFQPKTLRLWHGRGAPTNDELRDIHRAATNLSLDFKDWRAGRRPRPRQPSLRLRGAVYIVRAGENVKIGFTQNVAARMRQLQKGTPESLEVLLMMAGSPVLERELHRRFQPLRIRDEWFRLAAPILDFIAGEKRKNLSETQMSESPRVVRIAKKSEAESIG